MDQTAQWLAGLLMGIVLLLAGGWGKHVMGQLKNHEEKMEEVYRKLEEIELARAQQTLTNALTLERIETKVNTLIEVIRVLRKDIEEEE